VRWSCAGSRDVLVVVMVLLLLLLVVMVLLLLLLLLLDRASLSKPRACRGSNMALLG